MFKYILGVIVTFMFGVQSALAALPASVSADITTAKTDGTDLAYQFLGLAVAVGVILWLKRKA